MQKYYVTVGPFENQAEAQKFEQGRTLIKPRPRIKIGAEKDLADLFPVLMNHAKQDPALYDDLLHFQNYVRDQTSRIERAQRPLHEILKDHTKAYRGGYLRANLGQPCLICGLPVRAHHKTTLKHHLALLSNLMNRPKIKKLELVT